MVWTSVAEPALILYKPPVAFLDENEIQTSEAIINNKPATPSTFRMACFICGPRQKSSPHNLITEK